MEETQKSMAGTVALVAAVIGVVVGYGIGAALTDKKAADKVAMLEKDKQSMMAEKAARGEGGEQAVPMTDTAAANLRVVLNSLQRQHVNLASAAVRSGFDGKADFEAVAKELDNNSVAIAKAVGSVYGADAETRFLEIWRSHIGFFVDYTVAAKKGDKAGMDKAVANLGGYVDGVADFLSKANPNLPREAVKALVGEHVTLLKGAVDAYGGKDYAKSYAEQAKADAQIGQIADALSGAIVKQYPDKF